MEIASLILSILAFIGVVPLWALFLAKNYFSTHTVQLQPVDSFMPSPSMGLGRVYEPPIPPSIMEQYRDVDAPMTQEEREYFMKRNPGKAV